MITTRHHPDRDTLLYDGRCRFCRSQIAILRWCDITGRLQFTSLHDASVARDFPEIPYEDLLKQMYLVSRTGQARGGAVAVRALTRKLPLLWPAAVLLHLPGSLPLWSSLYAFVARHRLKIAGSCDDGTCRIP